MSLFELSELPFDSAPFGFAQDRQDKKLRPPKGVARADKNACPAWRRSAPPKTKWVRWQTKCVFTYGGEGGVDGKRIWEGMGPLPYLCGANCAGDGSAWRQGGGEIRAGCMVQGKDTHGGEGGNEFSMDREKTGASPD